MKLLSYRGRGRKLDRLIKWWTNGSYSHSEIQFSDGICFSSSSRDGGVRFKRIDINPDRWSSVDIPIKDEAALITWCKTQVGRKYDWRGILGFGIMPFRDNLQNRKKWYCSEICAEVIRRSGEHTMLPKKISPSLLHRWLGGDD